MLVVQGALTVEMAPEASNPDDRQRRRPMAELVGEMPGYEAGTWRARSGGRGAWQHRQWSLDEARLAPRMQGTAAGLVEGGVTSGGGAGPCEAGEV